MERLLLSEAGEPPGPGAASPSMEDLIRQRLAEAENPEDAYRQLVADAKKEAEKVTGKPVMPEPGFCMKTTQEDGAKVFINYCHSDKVWPPKTDANDEELLRIIETGDNRKFSVPVAMSDPRAELDKSGKGCTVYTAIVNTKLIRDCESRPHLRDFLMEMALQHIELKSNVLLSRDVKILKRKFMGTLHEQNIRSTRDALVSEVSDPTTASTGSTVPKSKPVIEIMDSQPASDQAAQPSVITGEANPSTNGMQEPEFVLLKEPEDNPDFLCLEVKLPKARNMKGTTLDIGRKAVRLICAPSGYVLETRLPCAVAAKDGGAQFDKQSHILTVTLPVVK